MPSLTKSMPQIEALQKLLVEGSDDFLRQALTTMLNTMMELEVSHQIEAQKHQRSSSRKSYRNGSRSRSLSTGIGELSLNVPKVRSGESYYPTFLEPHRMVDKALVGVIQEAYINGVSTRKVDKLVEDLGLKVDKSAVSR